MANAQTPVPTREERDISSFLRGGPRDGQGATKPRQGVEKALKDGINQRRLNVDELWQQAKAQRMQRVMATYLEALL